MSHQSCPVITTNTLPDVLPSDEIVRLVPQTEHDTYHERTDRDIGWITTEEQDRLRTQTVAIAGCGGMGGLLASIFVRLGIGTVRIADCEVFDTSNINRQFAATKTTVGRSKAFSTAALLREIADDTTIEVFPMGVSSASAQQFVSDADVICDMIEFWAIGARMLLHAHAREQDIPIFNGNTVGHRTYLFRYTATSMSIEDATGISQQEAESLESRYTQGTATADDRRRVMAGIYRAFAPEIPEYRDSSTLGTAGQLDTRLFTQGRVPIIATNPPMAAGFVANHVLFELLRRMGAAYRHTTVPAMPGYLSFDAAFMEARRVSGVWW